MHNNITEDLKFFNELINEFLNEERVNPVSLVIPVDELKLKFDLSLNSDPAISDKFRKELRKIVLNTPKSSSNRFFNQLFGGRHSKAVLGDLLSVMLNTSMATYKIAGPQVAVEKEIIEKVNMLIGYTKKGKSKSILPGGTFPTGGSMSNFMSMLMARDKKDSQIKNKGIQQRLIAYTSENAHYSINKSASFIGVGKENIRHISSDKYGRINVNEFNNQVQRDIKKGLTPFYLNATAGTTVLGAFDSVIDLAPICKKHNIWFHLDGAFGGSVIFSTKHRDLIKGVDLTDSFCFNPHKTLGTPISTSILVVKNNKDLYNSFDNEANYLYQTHTEEYNLGKTSFECGRRNNALKFWCLWKAVGTNGLEKIIDHEFVLADFARNYVLNNKDYTLYSSNESLSVCFNYKNYDAKDLCTKLYESSKLMVGFGCFHENSFIRLVTINSENSIKEILNFFKIIEEFAFENSEVIKRRIKSSNSIEVSK